MARHWSCVTFVATILFCLNASLSLPVPRFDPEPIPHAPNGWKRVALSRQSTVLPILVALHRETHGWEDLLLAVSTPGSSSYGKHLTHDEVKALAAPSADCINRVEEWLSSVAEPGSVRLVGHGDWMAANVSVRGLSRLLETRFWTWSHPLTWRTLDRCERYTIPSELSDCIDLVADVKMLPKLHKHLAKRSSRKSNDWCEWVHCGMEPNKIRKIFSISGTGSPNNGNAQAVAEFNVGDNFSYADLKMYQQGWNLPVIPVAKVVGPNDPNKPSIESDMDIQLIIGVNQGTPTWVFNNGPDSFFQWLVKVASFPNPPLVHSVSYGEDYDTISNASQTRCNQEFIKMGAMGVTFIFASGDYGVNCDPEGDFNIPVFPAGSPFVTSVGGMLYDTKTGAMSSDPITGGGFSYNFGTPPWGKSAMEGYVAQHTPPPDHSFFNVTGRGYPDLASFSEDIEFVWQNSWSFTGGTSCAAPVVAAMISLLNDLRINAKKPPLGFLNPMLYQLGATNPSVFFDIVSGQRNTQGSCVGFAPAKGWDPISGWGAINYEEMAKAIMNF